MTQTLNETPPESESLPVEVAGAPPVESEPPPHVIVRPNRSPSWGFTLGFIVVILTTGFLIYKLITMPVELYDTTIRTAQETVTDVAESISDAFKVTVSSHTVILSALQSMHLEPKLVVLTASVDVEVEMTSEKRVLWGFLNLGDTTARLRARDNKVQYYIPLENVRQDSFHFDKEKGALILTLPAPQLDEDVVDVQSDPGKLELQTDVGWARFQSRSGDFIEAKARESLRTEVLRAGRHPLLAEKAALEANKKLEALLGGLKGALKDGLKLEFQFE